MPSTSRFAKVIVAALALAAITPAATADPRVSIIAAQQEGRALRVIGVAEYGASMPAGWGDARGDTFIAGGEDLPLGADLVGADVRWVNAGLAEPSAHELEFRWKLADQGLEPTGPAESVVYLWQFAVENALPDFPRRAYGLWGMRSSQYHSPGSANPIFRLIVCDGGHEFAGGCTGIATLKGTFDTSTDPSLRVRLPFGLVGAREGSRIVPAELFPGHGGGLNISTHLALASGATWVFDPIDAMRQREFFEVPLRTVDVSIAPAGQVPSSWRPAELAEDAATFEAVMEAPSTGTYDAWARACLGPTYCSAPAKRAVAHG